MTDTLTEMVAPDDVAASGPIVRSFTIDDLVVRSDGDGRTVDAYAAVFDSPAEVQDQYGHYYETIDRAAFNGVLASGAKPAVFFNHGRDIYGNPSDKWSAPVAVHRSATPDGRGLRVSSWYVKTPAGDEALELMRSGAVDGFSFSGKPNRSKTIPAAADGSLPTILRQQLSLVEYGPAVFRTYDEAKVLAFRSDQIVDQLGRMTAEQADDLIAVLRSRFPDLAVGGSGDREGVDDTASPLVAGEFNQQRRLMAARLRGIIQ